MAIALLLLFGFSLATYFGSLPSVARIYGQTPSSSCGLASPAFCDTFSQAFPVTNRAGQLDGTVWGASRVSSANGQGELNAWLPASASQCNTGSVLPPNDIQVCNGHIVEAVADDDQTNLAMYPKQPFDIAGRTGKVAFDVGADSEGGHAAWPTFIYTSLPTPAPGFILPGLTPIAANMFGFNLDNQCAAGSLCYNQAANFHTCPNDGRPVMNVGEWFSATNYQYTTGNGSDTEEYRSCVYAPTAADIAAGRLNHFEVDFLPSGNEVDVYGSDPGQGQAGQRLLVIIHTHVPLTRGLIWMADEHYAACKFNDQCNHSFVWDNVGFDGPVLVRDLDVEVPDALQPLGHTDAEGQTPTNLGYALSTTPQTLTFGQPVTNTGSGAVLTLSYEPSGPNNNIVYSLNGGPQHTLTVPYPSFSGGAVNCSPCDGMISLSAAVPLAEVHSGANTVTLSVDHDTGIVANIDLKLVGAGGTVPCNCGGGTPVPTATASASATTQPTNTPLPVVTATPTSTPVSTPVSTPTQPPATNTPIPTVAPTATASPSPTAICQAAVKVNGLSLWADQPIAFCANSHP